MLVPARRELRAASVLVAAALALLLPVLAAAAPAGAAKKPGSPRPSPTASPGPTPTASPSPSPAPATTRWAPTVGTAWQVQYTGPVDTTIDVPVYDLDGFDTPASTVAALRASGRHAICYISAGSWEDWRPDAAAFPSSVLGASNGWPSERWLDIRQLAVLQPLLTKRMTMCRDKGFEAVDPDNVDGYANRTGFPLTAADQLAFNRWLAAEAHRLGLSVGLKNDLDQVPELVADFDFAVNEQCVEYSECAALRPFTDAGKAVLHIEYATSPSAYCPTTVAMRLSSLLKRTSLDAWRQTC